MDNLKFHIGSYCWFMYENLPIRRKIVKIVITPESIIYELDLGKEYECLRRLPDSDIFKTKRELINSLYGCGDAEE